MIKFEVKKWILGFGPEISLKKIKNSENINLDISIFEPFFKKWTFRLVAFIKNGHLASKYSDQFFGSQKLFLFFVQSDLKKMNIFFSKADG